MGTVNGLNRRAFLRSAGLTAVAGAMATRGAGALGPIREPAVSANGKYDFDTVYNRFGTSSTKYDQQIRVYGPGSVDVGMGIADMDFRAAPPITAALKKRLEHENWGYYDSVAVVGALTAHIVAYNKRHYGTTIDPGTVVLSNGVHPALIAAIQTFSPRGTRVLMQTPVYNGFYSDLRFTGTPAAESPLRLVNGRYSMDFEDFERRISHDTHTFILCNPQNPTGNCWSQADLLRIGEICLRRRVVVLADEIHCDFVNKGQKYTPFANLPNKAVVDNSLTFKAASKSFGLATHRIGWFFSTNPDLLSRVSANHRNDLTALGIAANAAALTECDDWLAECVAYIDANQEFAASFIADKLPLIKWTKAEGTYLAWLDMTAVAERINSKKLADEHNAARPQGAPRLTPEQMLERFFVKHAKVHLNQGASYGLGGEHHMRMNLATSRKMLEKALTNMVGALKNV